jgi:hypothetical protein
VAPTAAPRRPAPERVGLRLGPPAALLHQAARLFARVRGGLPCRPFARPPERVGARPDSRAWSLRSRARRAAIEAPRRSRGGRARRRPGPATPPDPPAKPAIRPPTRRPRPRPQTATAPSAAIHPPVQSQEIRRLARSEFFGPMDSGPRRADTVPGAPVAPTTSASARRRHAIAPRARGATVRPPATPPGPRAPPRSPRTRSTVDRPLGRPSARPHGHWDDGARRRPPRSTGPGAAGQLASPRGQPARHARAA